MNLKKKRQTTFEGLINIDQSKKQKKKIGIKVASFKKTNKETKKKKNHFKIETTRREISLERKNVLFFHPLSRWRDSLALHKAQFAFENRCFAARFYRRGISSRPRYTVTYPPRCARMRANFEPFVTVRLQLVSLPIKTER